MKVFITKYALTQGIFEEEAVMMSDEMIKVLGRPGCVNQYYHRDEWHLNFSGARSKAEEMRLKKMVSLEKQIRKLNRLKFDQND